MSLPIVLRPEVESDLLAAQAWYEQQLPGLGGRFLSAVEQVLARIEAMPEMYAVILRNVRRAKVRRFPYVVYYRILTDRIEVIAILHGGRDPRLWQSRA